MPQDIQPVNSARVSLARKCLLLISEIAALGAVSQDPEDVGSMLPGLAQVLCERSGSAEKRFEPVSPDYIPALCRLHQRLEVVN
jgi:hypothetical protein